MKAFCIIRDNKLVAIDINKFQVMYYTDRMGDGNDNGYNVFNADLPEEDIIRIYPTMIEDGWGKQALEDIREKQAGVIK